MQSPSQPEARRLRDLSPEQWKSGIAAWLGWLFDGLDMHLFTLVATPFVMVLLGGLAAGDPEVKEKGSFIQAAFMVGWALGGGLFGRIGDLIGRSRALCLTILTYALFTGLSSVAQTWIDLMIYRFISALGIGGEWAIGSALLAETWPRKWRPWIAAVLQTGVNIGVLLACLTNWMMKDISPRYVFLVGVLPAFIVLWIRRHVPEPEEWKAAKAKAQHHEPGVMDLFYGPVRRTTLLTILVCAAGLSGWWAFMFWQQYHVMNLPELASWPMEQRRGLVAQTFFWIIGISIFGNFLGGWLAKNWGYRKAISLMCAGFVVTFIGAFGWKWDYVWLTSFWLPAIGFWSGLFGLFTMFLPPLFPTLLRTTGAGFCYNIGRLVSAAAIIFFGARTATGDFRLTLLCIGMLFLIPLVAVLFLREPAEDAH